MTTADGFVCVSWWRDKDCAIPPYKGTYDYQHYNTLEEAYEAHREFEAGEYARATACGIFACVNGMPVGARVL